MSRNIGLVYFFGVKAFLILTTVTVKIIYLGFLASYASKVALIIYISIKRGAGYSLAISFWLSTVFYLILGSVLGMELISDLGLGFLNILFIVKY